MTPAQDLKKAFLAKQLQPVHAYSNAISSIAIANSWVPDDSLQSTLGLVARFDKLGNCAPRQMAVEIFNWQHYNTWYLNGYGTLMHEFGHIYHGLLGFGHEGICRAFQRAHSSGHPQSI